MLQVCQIFSVWCFVFSPQMYKNSHATDEERLETKTNGSRQKLSKNRKQLAKHLTRYILKLVPGCKIPYCVRLAYNV